MMMPNQESQALSQAIYAIDNALGFLANWCPHGGDSERSIDYLIADDVKKLLIEAREHLAHARNQNL